MKKAFGQTVREFKREVNKKVLKVHIIEQKVLDSTSNDPWGPHGTHLADIAQATRNYNEYQMIMAVLWKRVSDTGKNWRHVYKALVVLEYLVAHGSERVIDEIREHAYQISTLSKFHYIDSGGRDQGSNVRKKAQSLVALINDKERIQEVRRKALAFRDKYQNSSSLYRSNSHSDAGGYGERHDDRQEGHYGERNGYGREGDPYNWGGDRHGRDCDDHYSGDIYRYDDYKRSRGNDVYQYGSRNRSPDKEQDGCHGGDRHEHKIAELNIGAPPSYEEAVGQAQSSTEDERDRDTVTEPLPPSKASSPPGSTSQGQDETVADIAVSSPNKEFGAFGEFDPLACLPASTPTLSAAEMDLLNAFSDPLPQDSLALVPATLPTTTAESNAPIKSGFGFDSMPLSSASSVLSQPYENPFGDVPFVATPEDNFVPPSQNFASPNSFQLPVPSEGSPLQSPAPSVEAVSNFEFGNTFQGITYAPPNVVNAQPPNVANAQPPTFVANAQPPTFVANAQPPTHVANTQPPTHMTNAQPPTHVANAQPPPHVANAQSPPHVANAQHPTYVANAQPPHIANAQPTHVANAQPPTDVADVQPPVIANVQSPSPVTNVQPSTHVGNVQPPSHIANIQPRVEAVSNFDSGDTFQDIACAPSHAPNVQPPSSIANVQHPTHIASVQHPTHILNAQLPSHVPNVQPSTTSDILPSELLTAAQPSADILANLLPLSGPSTPLASQTSLPAHIDVQASPPAPIVSQKSLPVPATSQASLSSTGLPAKPVQKFAPKSTVWADTLSRGLVDLNISGPKTNPLADIGIDFDAINRKEKRREDKSTSAQVTSTITMGKAMGSGSGIGRAGAGGLLPPPNPMIASSMGMGMGGGAGMGMGSGAGMGVGMGMGGYNGGMNQPMGMGMGGGAGMGMGISMGGYGGINQPMGMNMGASGMGMNVGIGQGAQMHPAVSIPPTQGMPGGGYSPMMGMGGYASQQPYGGYR